MASAQGSRRRSIDEGRCPIAVVGVIVLVLPLFIPSFVSSLVTKMMIYGLFGMSLNLIWGYANIPSFGHAAFFGVGAYTAGDPRPQGRHLQLLARPAAGHHRRRRSSRPSWAFPRSGCSGWGRAPSTPSTSFWPPSPSASCSRAWPSPCGRSPAAAPACRASRSRTSGSASRSTRGRYYYLVFVICVICLFLMYRIVNSHYGYALRGIHDNEKRMQALGYNTWLYKYTSWIIAAVFGGVAGVLFAYFGSTLVPNNIAMVTSDISFLLVILGGTTVFFGPLVAAVFYVGIEYLASIYLPQRWPLIFGAMFVIAIMMIPWTKGRYRDWARDPAAVEEGDPWRCLRLRAYRCTSAAWPRSRTSPSASSRASGWPSSAPTAPARPPSSTCSPGNSSPRAARCSSRARTSPTPRSSRARIWAWPAPSRSPASSPTRASWSTP